MRVLSMCEVFLGSWLLTSQRSLTLLTDGWLFGSVTWSCTTWVGMCEVFLGRWLLPSQRSLALLTDGQMFGSVTWSCTTWVGPLLSFVMLLVWVIHTCAGWLSEGWFFPCVSLVVMLATLSPWIGMVVCLIQG